jgi:hypothetical protein
MRFPVSGRRRALPPADVRPAFAGNFGEAVSATNPVIPLFTLTIV